MQSQALESDQKVLWAETNTPVIPASAPQDGVYLVMAFSWIHDDYQFSDGPTLRKVCQKLDHKILEYESGCQSMPFQYETSQPGGSGITWTLGPSSMGSQIIIRSQHEESEQGKFIVQSQQLTQQVQTVRCFPFLHLRILDSWTRYTGNFKAIFSPR